MPRPKRRMATHVMPDGEVMPGRDHAEYERMQRKKAGEDVKGGKKMPPMLGDMMGMPMGMAPMPKAGKKAKTKKAGKK